MSLELILPFLQPVAHLIADIGISEVMVNGDRSVFIQRNGRLEAVPNVSIEQKYLSVAVKRIARSLGEDIGESKPLLDARLSDGSRVAAAFPPCSLNGITLTIRKFRPHWFTMQQLVEAGALSSRLAGRLAQAVRGLETILISGGTDTGKTTFAKALIDFIPDSKRLGVIEDTAELKIEHSNVFRFEARREQRDASGRIVMPAVTIRDLVKATLRHRPDRLIIGEVRGGEAFDLLDALNTGHAGSISTVHANSGLQALSRLASLALRADVDLPYKALQAEIGDLIDLVVHLERKDGYRRVAHVLKIQRFDADAGCYETTKLSDMEGRRPRARQAVSPVFRATLVQPSASLRPFRSAARMGDPPRLDSCYPGPRRSGRGIRSKRNPNSHFRKEKPI